MKKKKTQMNRISTDCNKKKDRNVYTDQASSAVRDSSHVELHGHTAGAFHDLNLFSQVPVILKYARTSDSFQFLTHLPFINPLNAELNPICHLLVF
jgi:hypothetical protein